MNWPIISWAFFCSASRVCGCGSSFKNTGLRFGLNVTDSKIGNFLPKVVYFDDINKFSNGKRKLRLARLFWARDLVGHFDYEPFSLWKNIYNENPLFLHSVVEFINAIRAELLDGCYFNEIKILNRKEKQDKRAETLARYRKLRDAIYNDSYACFEIPEETTIKQ